MSETDRIKRYVTHWVSDGFTPSEIEGMIKAKHPDMGQDKVQEIIELATATMPSYFLKQKMSLEHS